MIPASPPVASYRCPGEPYDITRPVHLARLAAHYSKCRNCPHREGPYAEFFNESGSARTAHDDSSRLFGSEGVRGRYLNDITRHDCDRLTGAFASCLWDEWRPDQSHPDVGASIANAEADTAGGSVETVRILRGGRPGPMVVLAHDERPCAPDMVVGAGDALRRMGCQVVDIGLATRPEFWFAVRHLQAAGGVHVTGSGCDPGWTGLDFALGDALPCSRGARLDQIAQRYCEGYARPSRRPGAQRTLRLAAAYEATFHRHLHALRPLQIALAVASRPVDDLLQRLFRKLACRLIEVETPRRARDLSLAADPDAVRTVAAVRAQNAHFGILIDDDAQACLVFDETGARVEFHRLLSLFAAYERQQGRQGNVATEAPALQGGASLAAMHAAMSAPGVICGGGPSGRYWFIEPDPVCDAVLTLIRLLHILSESDAPLSARLADLELA